MKSLSIKNLLMAMLLVLPGPSFASDIVPFSVKRIKPVGAGYVELIGPGKLKLNNKVLAYEETKYIKKANIGTMTSPTDSNKGCVLAYASEGYTEDIIVRNQSCTEILSIFSAVR